MNDFTTGNDTSTKDPIFGPCTMLAGFGVTDCPVSIVTASGNDSPQGQGASTPSSDGENDAINAALQVANAIMRAAEEGLNAAEDGGTADYGPFHRLESPTQTAEVAQMQQQNGEIWGPGFKVL
jgi:hypothetical protein